MKNKKTYFIWFLFILLYLSFIGFFTYLYPISEDEMLCKVHNLDCVLYLYKNFCARISILFSGTFLFNTYKWGFVILNPIIQSVLVFLIFYLVNLRMPDFKTLKDFPQVVFTALACVFMVAQPDQTIFWFSGATNYLFLGVMFIAFCALMRKTWHTPDLIPSNIFTFIVAVSSGIVLGMNNENSAPMMFCLCALYIFAAIGFKKKIPHWFWFLFTGILAGMVVMFSSPIYHKRLNTNLIVKILNNLPLSQKLYQHLPNMDLFMASSLYTLPLMIIFIPLLIKDNFKKILKNEFFLFFILSCFISIMLSLVLFPLPIRPHRIVYSATLFTIAALLFLAQYIKDFYKFSILPYLLGLLLVYVSYTALPFAKPYFSLYRQDEVRQNMIRKYQKQDINFCLYTPVYVIPEGPTENLSINFFDTMEKQHIYAYKYYDLNFITGNELSADSY